MHLKIFIISLKILNKIDDIFFIYIWINRKTFDFDVYEIISDFFSKSLTISNVDFQEIVNEFDNSEIYIEIII